MDVVSPGPDLATCPTCGEANPARFRLCGYCGSELANGRPLDEIRRFVTVVNSDLKGSTALGEKLDPESLREVLTRYFDEMRIVFESHGGTIEKIIGDAIVAVFGMPVRRDDDALRAVDAAAESMRVLASLNDQLEAVWGVRLTTRTGVSSGEVVVGDVTASQHVLTGDTMKVASAMEQNSPPLEVLIAQPTLDLVRDFVEVEPMGPITPKGLEGATESYRLISVLTPPADAVAGHLDDPAPAPIADRRHCSNCGEENSDQHRLCGMCGTPLVLAAKAQESRKTVTLVFADPKPRTDTGEPPSPEALGDVMSRYFEAMKRALERHGGTVEKFIGDAVMAVYGLPVRHEDDALRALRAALDMQAALPALNEDFAARWGVRLLNAIGVNTGEVIAGDATLGQRLVTGDAVNVAARLEQAAGPAEVIVGDLTYRLAKDYAEVEAIPPLSLKGKAEPVPAFRLLAVRDRRVETTAGVAPFVGRDEEMVRLGGALAEAAGARVVRMVTVVGDAGVGKSRLIKEFATRAGREALVLKGRCLPYGDGITFWPISEVVREAAAIAGEDTPDEAIVKLRGLLERQESDPADREAVVDRVAAMIGLSFAQFPVAELFWGARKFLEAMAREHPLVVLVDDIHSAEQTLLELLDHLVEAGRDAMIVLLCSARRELLEKHEDWSEAHSPELIVLDPLSDADSGRMVEELLGQTGLDESIVARITTAAEGNPLFVEQMVSMLIDTGALRNEDGRWIAAAAASEIAVPPSIHALLAARFDSLGVEEKRVLEPASVIGLSFAVPAIQELVDETARPTLATNLTSLDRKQFVKPTTLDEDEAYKFAHILVRDTAYGSLLKRARAQYHERFVDWAERINAERGRGQEFEEIHGYHLEQAYRYRTELGVIDEKAIGLGRRAAAKLQSAGRRAFVRGDSPAAANLLLRAAGVLPQLDPTRVELLSEAADAEIELGNFDAARTALDVARAAGEALDDPRLLARESLVRQHLGVRTSGSFGEPGEVVARVMGMIPHLEAAGDLVGLTIAWHWLSLVYYTTGALEKASGAASRVVDIASRAGNGPLAARSAVLYSQVAVDSPMPVQEGLRRCQELFDIVSRDRIAEARFLASLAILDAMAGRIDQARALYHRSEQMIAETGASVTAAGSSLDWSRVEMLAGDLDAAEQHLRRALRILVTIDERFYRPTVAAVLAQVLYARGAYSEAAACLAQADELVAEDDTFTLVVLRSTRAKLWAREGRSTEAIALANEALELARGGYAYQAAEALVDLAEVWRVTGLDDPEPPLREALGFFERKGDVVSAARVRSLLAARGPEA